MNPSSSNFSARAHFPAQNRLTEPICVNVDRIPFLSLSKRTFRINLTVYISGMMSCWNGCKSDEFHSTEDFTVQTVFNLVDWKPLKHLFNFLCLESLVDFPYICIFPHHNTLRWFFANERLSCTWNVCLLYSETNGRPNVVKWTTTHTTARGVSVSEMVYENFYYEITTLYPRLFRFALVCCCVNFPVLHFIPPANVEQLYWTSWESLLFTASEEEGYSIYMACNSDVASYTVYR